MAFCLWSLSFFFPGTFNSEDSYIEAVQLISILALVSSGFVFFHKVTIGIVIRNIAAWSAISASVLLAYTYRFELYVIYNQVAGELIPSKAVVIKDKIIAITKSSDGHFYAFGKANGVSLKFLVDTGATNIVLSPKDAKRIGVQFESLRFVEKYLTANGISYGAPYRLESMEIGNFVATDIKISINQADMDTSLLGMSLLKYFNSIEIRKQKLILKY